MLLLLLLLSQQQNEVMGVAVNYNSTRAATVSLDGTWRVWDITVRYNLDEDPRCAAIYTIDPSKGESLIVRFVTYCQTCNCHTWN
jgi:hypothetical protein